MSSTRSDSRRGTSACLRVNFLAWSCTGQEAVLDLPAGSDREHVPARPEAQQERQSVARRHHDGRNSPLQQEAPHCICARTCWLARWLAGYAELLCSTAADNAQCLALQIKANDIPTAMRFGPYGREEATLIVAFKSGLSAPEMLFWS